MYMCMYSYLMVYLVTHDNHMSLFLLSQLIVRISLWLDELSGTQVTRP